MRVILEGCDGTGKTSVSELLANKLNCNIIRLTRHGYRALRSYKHLMSAEYIVHDRSFISETIYPKYFNEARSITDGETSELWDYIKIFDIKVFVLTANPEEIVKRFNTRGDEFLKDASVLQNINNDYLCVAKEKNLIVIDTTDKTIQQVVEEIGDYLND